MLKKVCDPFRILHICLTSGHCFHMASIHHYGVQIRRFKNVKQRLPIRGCDLHCDHFTTAFLEPVSQCKKLSGCCTKLTYFLFFAAPKAGNDKLFVHINTTTFVVNFIHYWHLRGKIYGTVLCLLSFYYTSFCRELEFLEWLDRWWCK